MKSLCRCGSCHPGGPRGQRSTRVKLQSPPVSADPPLGAELVPSASHLLAGASGLSGRETPRPLIRPRPLVAGLQGVWGSGGRLGLFWESDWLIFT